jgi:hypothetical protein
MPSQTGLCLEIPNSKSQIPNKEVYIDKKFSIVLPGGKINYLALSHALKTP